MSKLLAALLLTISINAFADDCSKMETAYGKQLCEKTNATYSKDNSKWCPAHNFKYKGDAHIGASKEETLRCSNWGKPKDVRTTIIPGELHEQWYYGGQYFLYFDNGVLTAIQS
jgi:hypothetical protein